MKKILNALKVFASECWSSPSTPAQIASIYAFKINDKEIDLYRKKVIELHSSTTIDLWNHLIKLGIECAKPLGAFYIYPSFETFKEHLLKENVKTSKELADWLLEKWNISTLPAISFGEKEKLNLRLATSGLYKYKDILNDNISNTEYLENAKSQFTNVIEYLKKNNY